MSEHNRPVISAALMRAQAEVAARSPSLQDMLSDTLVQEEVPTETAVPVAKPKRSTKAKVVD